MAFWKAAKDRAAISRLLDEKMHALAMQEIESGVRRDGLWAKATLAGSADERQTKLAYLRLLVQHLKDEHYIAERTREREEYDRASVEQTEQDEGKRRTTKQDAEAMHRNRGANASSDSIRQPPSLIGQLRERDLNFQQYEALAAMVGGEFGYRGLLWGKWWVTLDGTTVQFKKYSMLRPWFLENIASRVDA